jgi:DnaJ-class molecular chaperone
MNDKRTVDLGPGIPRVDIEPLSVAATVQDEPCPECRGTGRGNGSDEYGWHKCEGCGGAGETP